MPQCSNCRTMVDYNAAFCPSCGRPEPGKEGGGACLIVALIILCLFLTPAMLVARPFVDSFKDAFFLSLKSVWAWVGCGVFWGLVGLWYFGKGNAQTNGRQFTCFNCGQGVIEMRFGDLESCGVICPNCHTNNFFQQ